MTPEQRRIPSCGWFEYKTPEGRNYWVSENGVAR